MLQFPTNIYPQNVAFDPSVADDKNRLRFIFNGDILTSASFKIYNYQTGEYVSGSGYATPDATPWHYNGEQVSFSNGTLGDGLSAGNDYTIQMLLTQSKTDGSAPIYDMCVVRGSIQETSTTATSLKLKDGIMNIYEWNVVGGLCRPTILDYIIAGMIIKIGTETRFIESYNRTTGELIIESAFTTTPQLGDTYEIYSNYLVTPQYYFKCETYPTLNVTGEITHSGHSEVGGYIHVEGGYNQAQNCMIKSYTLKLYWNVNNLSPSSPEWKLIKELPPVYSQNIVGDFYDCLVGVDTIRNDDVLRATYYKVQCDIITQDGMLMSASHVLGLDVNDSEDYLDIDSFVTIVSDSDKPDYIPSEAKTKHHSVKLQLNYVPFSYRDGEYYLDFYRKDLENKKIIKLNGCTSGSFQSRYDSYTDYTIPNKGKFKYYCVPRDWDTSEPYSELIQMAEIEVNMLGWSITYLRGSNNEHSNNDNHYGIGDCWKFVGEIQDNTITQNLDRVVHVGHNRYTAISTGVPNYASGTLSAMLGYVDCVDKKFTDTIDMVNAWREFITQDGIFMLKSPKGDVFIVVITDAPTTTYQEDNIAFPTTFSFSWAECASLDDIYIQPW